MSGFRILRKDSVESQYLCKRDEKMAQLIPLLGEFEYELYDDPYYFLVSTIIGQMLSNKVGAIITDRLKSLCSGHITPDVIAALSDEVIRSTGLSKSKTVYIRALTKAVKDGALDFSEFSELSDVEVIKKLTALRGIGMWTAKMYLIFVLDRKDILPFEDGAFLQAYKCVYNARKLDPRTIERRCRIWKPYSSIAARYLYRALDSGLALSLKEKGKGTR